MDSIVQRLSAKEADAREAEGRLGDEIRHLRELRDLVEELLSDMDEDVPPGVAPPGD